MIIIVLYPLIKINNIKEYKLKRLYNKFVEMNIFIGGFEKDILIYKSNTYYDIILIEYKKEKNILLKLRKIEIEQDEKKRLMKIIETNEENTVMSERFKLKNKDAIIIIEYEITINGIKEIKKEKILAKYERKIYLTCPLWEAMMGI